MKLLLDENLSDRIVRHIADRYPGSAHIKSHGLLQADDAIIWQFARDNRFIIVSKDADFHQRSLLFGHPPKLVFLRIGNCSTDAVIELLRTHHETLVAFNADRAASILVLP